jgi:hypothetical protein
MQPNRNSNFILISTLIASTFLACKREIINPSQAAFIASTERSGSPASNTAYAHIAASEKLIIPAAVEVPANLPGGNTRVATFYAVGVQKYKAREKAGSYPLSYEWMFVAPQADLYDVTDAKVGTHGAGPFWQISPMDYIFAQHFSPAKTAPSPDPESIDWLLLMPKTGTTPTGIFRDVAYIQRIATKGGKAPMTPPATSTETVEVKYKAVYRFIKMKP